MYHWFCHYRQKLSVPFLTQHTESTFGTQLYSPLALLRCPYHSVWGVVHKEQSPCTLTSLFIASQSDKDHYESGTLRIINGKKYAAV